MKFTGKFSFLIGAAVIGGCVATGPLWELDIGKASNARTGESRPFDHVVQELQLEHVYKSQISETLYSLSYNTISQAYQVASYDFNANPLNEFQVDLAIPEWPHRIKVHSLTNDAVFIDLGDVASLTLIDPVNETFWKGVTTSLLDANDHVTVEKSFINGYDDLIFSGVLNPESENIPLVGQITKEGELINLHLMPQFSAIFFDKIKDGSGFFLNGRHTEQAQGKTAIYLFDAQLNLNNQTNHQDELVTLLVSENQFLGYRKNYPETLFTFDLNGNNATELDYSWPGYDAEEGLSELIDYRWGDNVFYSINPWLEVDESDMPWPISEESDDNYYGPAKAHRTELCQYSHGFRQQWCLKLDLEIAGVNTVYHSQILAKDSIGLALAQENAISHSGVLGTSYSYREESGVHYRTYNVDGEKLFSESENNSYRTGKHDTCYYFLTPVMHCVEEEATRKPGVFNTLFGLYSGSRSVFLSEKSVFSSVDYFEEKFDISNLRKKLTFWDKS